MKGIILVSIAAVGLSGAGCGGGTSSRGATGTGGSGGSKLQADGAAGTGGGPQCQTPAPNLAAGAPQCNTVANIGASWITPTSYPNEPAAPGNLGGTLTDGVYLGTALDVYGGTDTVQVRDTVYVSGGGINLSWAGSVGGAASVAAVNLDVFSSNGMEINCGTPTSPVLLAASVYDTVAFGATSSAFVIHSAASGSPTFVETFTLTACPAE
ncbi:MAG TPA: hypothetical protein VLC06_06820 [Polyangia bacterium]|jgi:hypothetical protein|nr:hypothetical protein [Polyangia bacterium]